MRNNVWCSVKEQSLGVYARSAGFDLAIYEEYSEDVKEVLKKRAIKEAIDEISDSCEDQGFDFWGARKGVYVISLSQPLSLRYRSGRSQVIYIGIGRLKSRIKRHFEKTLFDLMQDLSGANFDFHFAVPARRHAALYYKHVEYLMLDHFSEQYGGMDERRRFPLLNKNAGSDRGYNSGSEWWKKPLKASGRRPLWEIRPTSYSDYAPLDP